MEAEIAQWREKNRSNLIFCPHVRYGCTKPIGWINRKTCHTHRTGPKIPTEAKHWKTNNRGDAVHVPLVMPDCKGCKAWKRQAGE